MSEGRVVPANPIPVEEARQLGLAFGWRVVVVCAWDGKGIQVTTWGREALDKTRAARAGDLCASALGFSEPGPKTEDFRTIDAARNAQLRDIAPGVVSALRSYQHGNSSPELAAEMADKLQALLDGKEAA